MKAIRTGLVLLAATATATAPAEAQEAASPYSADCAPSTITGYDGRTLPGPTVCGLWRVLENPERPGTRYAVPNLSDSGALQYWCDGGRGRLATSASKTTIWDGDMENRRLDWLVAGVNGFILWDRPRELAELKREEYVAVHRFDRRGKFDYVLVPGHGFSSAASLVEASCR